nr:hypothetical protein [Tanacetum cinerariifolium]
MTVQPPQVEVKSFPAEPINPLACNTDDTYIVGEGVSSSIYLWEVATGRLLKKCHGYRGPNTIIVSASQDRTCKVWSLAKGTMLRNIVFTSVIDAVALDPGKHVFVMLVVEMERYTLQN